LPRGSGLTWRVPGWHPPSCQQIGRAWRGAGVPAKRPQAVLRPIRAPARTPTLIGPGQSGTRRRTIVGSVLIVGAEVVNVELAAGLALVVVAVDVLVAWLVVRFLRTSGGP
jgi:hypothetical protein